MIVVKKLVGIPVSKQGEFIAIGKQKHATYKPPVATILANDYLGDIFECTAKWGWDGECVPLPLARLWQSSNFNSISVRSFDLFIEAQIQGLIKSGTIGEDNVHIMKVIRVSIVRFYSRELQLK